MPGICELTPDGLNFLGKSGRQGRSELCAPHRDVDYRGDCSQVKGGAQEPGEPHLRPMISWALSYSPAGSFFIIGGVSRQHLSPLPRGIS